MKKAFLITLLILPLVSCNAGDIYINPSKLNYGDLKENLNSIRIYHKRYKNESEKDQKGGFKVEYVDIQDSNIIQNITNIYESCLNYEFLSFENRTGPELVGTYAATIDTKKGQVYYVISEVHFGLYLFGLSDGPMGRGDKKFSDELNLLKESFATKQPSSYYTNAFGYDEDLE